MPVLDQLPELPGPTHDRLLAVSLMVPVHFLGTQLDTINTQRFGVERGVDMSTIALRMKAHRGVPMLLITYQGMTRGVPWHQVRHFTPHPDMEFDGAPARAIRKDKDGAAGN